MSKNRCSPVGTSRRMRRSVNGARSTANDMPTIFGAVAVDGVISGIWMRSFSRFMVSGTISDGRSIRMAMSSRSLAQRRRDKKAAKKFTSNTLLEAARTVWLYEKGWDASHCRFHHVSTMRSTARWNPTIHLSARRCRVRRAKPPQITLYGRTTRPSAPHSMSHGLH
jgi:hypothetical protein